METKNNVPDPVAFTRRLSELMDTLYHLFELTREHELELDREEEGIRDDEEFDKTCFQVSSQYERPTEFLQTLLDIIRVTYEPIVCGTLFLNANPCFIGEAIPDKPFRLGYASLVSAPGEAFPTFWRDKMLPALTGHGYDVDTATAMFVVVSTGKPRFTIELVDEVNPFLGAGFSVKEALGLLRAAVDERVDKPVKQVYAGYCLAEDLEDRLRVSVWLFLEQADSKLKLVFSSAGSA